MLESVGKLNCAIVLCDDIDRMKAFYREFFPFPVVSETETSLALGAGHVLLWPCASVSGPTMAEEAVPRRLVYSFSCVARRSRRVSPTAG